MAKQCPRCLSCNTFVETQVKSNIPEIVAKSIGVDALGVAGFVTLSMPTLHSVGVMSLLGAGALGKTIPKANCHQIAYHRCKGCGYKWK